jgi:hypothetical protein
MAVAGHKSMQPPQPTHLSTSIFTIPRSSFRFRETNADIYHEAQFSVNYFFGGGACLLAGGWKCFFPGCSKKTSSCKARHTLRNEAYFRVRCNDEG